MAQLGIWKRRIHANSPVYYDVWVEILGWTAERAKVRPLSIQRGEMFDTHTSEKDKDGNLKPLKSWYVDGWKPYVPWDYGYDAGAAARNAARMKEAEQYPLGQYVRYVPKDRVRVAAPEDIAQRVAGLMAPEMKVEERKKAQKAAIEREQQQRKAA